MPTDYDIAICGAGPVGLALGALLVRQGVTPARIALIDAKPLEQVAHDPRSIALSYGSRQILEQVEAWPAAVDAIHQIHVSRRGHFGRTLIDRDAYQLPALGYVTRYGAVVSALAEAAERMRIPSLRPLQVEERTEGEEAVALQLSDTREISARIVVQAEGGLFAGQAPKALHRDYDQIAIVAHVRVSAPIVHRAFERFTDEGPLALLPQEDGYALVWCARPASIEQLIGLPDSAFLAELGRAFGTRLGRFTTVSQRNTFPLGLNAEPSASARTVAIGNAAQTLHPVAGQGLNLGLRDAAVLAQMLARDTSPVALEQFAASRRSDRSLTIRLTDTLARIFASAPDGAWSQALLGLSLGWVDSFQPAKKLLAEQMMFGHR